MRRVLLSVLGALLLQIALPAFSWAQTDAADQTSDTSTPPVATAPAQPAGQTAASSHQAAVQAHDSAITTEAAAAATAARLAVKQNQRSPDFLEHLVDVILELFDVSSSGNTVLHYVVSILFLVAALLARRIVTGIIFVQLKKLAEKTATTLDDKLFPAMEAPTAAFVMVTGIFAALKVLKLSEHADIIINEGSTVAFALVIFWGLWCALDAVLDHAHEIALDRQLGIASFMPWIKKTLFSVFIVVGVLLTLKSLGYDVKALLAGLGIGGLAFALAAQDTLANVFGSMVVAVDQPFKVGEAIRIVGNVGVVEDIGLRSTRVRLADKSLMVIPNKTVASENITNLSRFTRRRVEQVLGLTYDTTPEQMTAIIADLKQVISTDPDVDKQSVMVFFRDFNASSLDLWVVYESASADFHKSMVLRERLNLAMMRAVSARGLGFAFPTQTIQLDGAIAKQLAERRA